MIISLAFTPIIVDATDSRKFSCKSALKSLIVSPVNSEFAVNTTAVRIAVDGAEVGEEEGLLLGWLEGSMVG
jgi:hypothetical protein